MVPDITIFGPYTYLATEVLWGAVAVGLLWYADAFRAAARTIVVLYPAAFVWDWYTLAVGVFEIPLRTGVDVLGIPIEEHVFIVVVPAVVVGAHESLRRLLDEPGRSADGEAGTQRPGEGQASSSDSR